MPASQLTVNCFGTPEVKVDDNLHPLPTRKATALLVYLAITARPQSRELLAALLWPNSETDRAKSSLRRALTDIKKAIGGGWVGSNRQAVWIKSTRIRVDVLQFQELVAKNTDATQWAKAIALYQGDFLDGFAVKNCYEFDEWLYFEAENLRQAYARVLDQLIEHGIKQQQYADSLPYARQRLALDTLHEPAHLQLMQLYFWAGQHSSALRQYRECKRLMEEELGVEPMPEIVALYEEIQAAEIKMPETRTRRAPRPGTPPPPPPKTNLLADSTSFVGREKELLDIQNLLAEPSARLITVVGLGGMGKTRLGITAARQHLDKFPDGVWFVDLAPVQTGEFLLTTIAGAIQFSFHGTDNIKQQLFGHLRDKRLLLLIDNFEHLIDSAPVLSELIQNSEYVKLLVTSREALDLHGEWVYQLDGLAYPKMLIPVDDAPTAQPLLAQPYMSYSAVQLFTQRARQASLKFSFGENQPHVLRICELTEGMPLALELAAAWVRLLSCAQIVVEIEKGLRVLSTTQRNVAERHRSIWAVFESSWQLLNETEQQLLARLSVFRGSFTWDAVEQVTEAPLFTFFALLNKSLVRTQSQERYDLHELLRQFAASKLEEMEGDPAGLSNRHTTYYANWLNDQKPNLDGQEQTKILNQIADDLDNHYQAWVHASQQHNLKALNQSTACLYTFHAIRSLNEQGNQLFQYAINHIEPHLTIANAQDSKTLLQILVRQADFLYLTGRTQEAETIFQETLERAEALSLEEELEKAYRKLGHMAYARGDYRKAQEMLSKALPLADKNNDVYSQAYAFMVAGAVALALGNYDDANQLHHKSLSLYRTVDYQFGIIHTLRFLGTVAFRQNEFDKARQFSQQSLELASQNNFTLGEVFAMNNLGLIAQSKGEYQIAQILFEKALQLARDSHTQSIVAELLQNLGKLLSQTSSPATGFPYLQEGLKQAVEASRVPIALAIMVDMVAQLPSGSQNDTVLKVLHIAQTHPSRTWETEQKAEHVIAQLSAPAQAQLLTTGFTEPDEMNTVLAELLDVDGNL